MRQIRRLWDLTITLAALVVLARQLGEEDTNG